MAAKNSVLVGDITQQKVDAVVNAANGELTGGSGVNGAIHKVGGPEIYRFCEELRATYSLPSLLMTAVRRVFMDGKI